MVKFKSSHADRFEFLAWFIPAVFCVAFIGILTFWGFIIYSLVTMDLGQVARAAGGIVRQFMEGAGR